MRAATCRTPGEYVGDSISTSSRRSVSGSGAMSLDLTSGRFRVPGGPLVSVEAPSRISMRDFTVRPDGGYSGVLGMYCTRFFFTGS